jgi:hypothetical protein
MYRSVALVDRSEYPTLVYEMDQLISMNGLDGVAFIALNHHVAVGAHLPETALADGPWLGPGRSMTLQL